MATSTNDTQSTGTAATGLAGVSPAAASRKRVTQTSRGLLVGGLLTMGAGLGLGAAFAGDNEAEPPVPPAPETVTETVTLHMETETVTASPEPGEAEPEEPAQDPEPAPGPVADVSPDVVSGRHAYLNSGDTYSVVQGDSLSSIAARAGVSLAALISANPNIPDPNLIYTGNIVTIP
mgnify:CR=1 FL=1